MPRPGSAAPASSSLPGGSPGKPAGATADPPAQAASPKAVVTAVRPATTCEVCKKESANSGYRTIKMRPPGATGRVGISRWCTRCRPPGTENLNTPTSRANKCEDCTVKRAAFGMPGEVAGWGTKRARWCGSCAKKHPGAQDYFHSMCKVCAQKRATFGTGSGKFSWCGDCKPKDAAACALCRDCTTVVASYGAPNRRRHRHPAGTPPPVPSGPSLSTPK